MLKNKPPITSTRKKPLVSVVAGEYVARPKGRERVGKSGRDYLGPRAYNDAINPMSIMPSPSKSAVIARVLGSVTIGNYLFGLSWNWTPAASPFAPNGAALLPRR